MNDLVPATFTLPRDLLTRIADAAAADERSRSAVVRRILAQALADHAGLQAEAARRFVDLQKSTPVSCPAAASSASGVAGHRPSDAVVETLAGADTGDGLGAGQRTLSRTKATR